MSENGDAPDGQITDSSVQCPREKYIASLFAKISFRNRIVSPRSEGRIAIVTDAGWDAVDALALLTNSAGCGR